MIDKHFTQLTEEDLVYSKLGNIAINFGYITSKEREAFFKFLANNNIVSKVNHCKNYRVLYPFLFRTVKAKKTDSSMFITCLFKQDIYIDYNYQELKGTFRGE